MVRGGIMVRGKIMVPGSIEQHLPTRYGVHLLTALLLLVTVSAASGCTADSRDTEGTVIEKPGNREKLGVTNKKPGLDNGTRSTGNSQKVKVDGSKHSRYRVLLRRGGSGSPDKVLGFNNSLAAMMAARDGDVVKLKEGKYRGGLPVENGVTVLGSGNGTELKPLNGSSFGFRISDADGAEVRNLSVEGFDRSGIKITGGSDVVIENVTVENSSFGVEVRGAEGNWGVRNSVITGNSRGVYVYKTGSEWSLNRTLIYGNSKDGVDVFHNDGGWKVVGSVVRDNGNIGLNVDGSNKLNTAAVKYTDIYGNGGVDASVTGNAGNGVRFENVWWGKRGGPSRKMTRGYIRVIDPCSQPCS
ncbi:MAG: right-handed parallel beta-helix repeat-containing protein [Halobacteria archaeon]